MEVSVYIGPGDWTLWSDWSLCTQTCQVTDPDGETHGGTRMRSRECDMTSHGELTAECTGDSTELEACHNITCWPCKYYRRCERSNSLDDK